MPKGGWWDSNFSHIMDERTARKLVMVTSSAKIMKNSEKKRKKKLNSVENL